MLISGCPSVFLLLAFVVSCADAACSNATCTVTCNSSSADCDGACVPEYYDVSNCTGCACMVNNTIGNSNVCNSTTGQCNCIVGAVGRDCSTCETGYFGDPCTDCGCNVSLSVSNDCDGSGICNCVTNATGDKCDVCEPGTYFSGSECSDCGCNVSLSVSGDCDDSGVCDCVTNATGDKCDVCEPGTYFSGSECSDCDCNTTLSVDETCDHAGTCTCADPNAIGPQCNACAMNYYFSGASCEACDCNVSLSTSLQCDISGACSCSSHAGGTKCDECDPQYYFSEGSCVGCSCDPFNSESVVCADSGQCNCSVGSTLRTCTDCLPEYFRWNLSSPCEECGCNPNAVNTTVCDSGGNCSCLEGATGRTCHQCLPGYSGSSCAVQDCVAHAYGKPDCECLAGLIPVNMMFNATLGIWVGSCFDADPVITFFRSVTHGVTGVPTAVGFSISDLPTLGTNMMAVVESACGISVISVPGVSYNRTATRVEMVGLIDDVTAAALSAVVPAKNTPQSCTVLYTANDMRHGAEFPVAKVTRSNITFDIVHGKDEAITGVISDATRSATEDIPFTIDDTFVINAVRDDLRTHLVVQGVNGVPELSLAMEAQLVAYPDVNVTRRGRNSIIFSGLPSEINAVVSEPFNFTTDQDFFGTAKLVAYATVAGWAPTLTINEAANTFSVIQDSTVESREPEGMFLRQTVVFQGTLREIIVIDGDPADWDFKRFPDSSKTVDDCHHNLYHLRTPSEEVYLIRIVNGTARGVSGSFSFSRCDGCVHQTGTDEGDYIVEVQRDATVGFVEIEFQYLNCNDTWTVTQPVFGPHVLYDIDAEFPVDVKMENVMVVGNPFNGTIAVEIDSISVASENVTFSSATHVLSLRNTTGRTLHILETFELNSRAQRDYIRIITDQFVVSAENCKAMWGDFCYEAFTSKTNFFDAEFKCHEWGGHLASVHSAEEKTFLQSLFSGKAYVGFSDLNSPGDLQWTDRTDVSFMESDCSDAVCDLAPTPTEHSAVLLLTTGAWERVNPRVEEHYICKGLAPRTSSIDFGGAGETAWVEIPIAVAPVNDPPIITSTLDFNITLGGSLFTYNITVFDPDDENDGVQLNYTLLEYPMTHAVEISSTGYLRWETKDSPETYNETIAFQVTDGGEDGSLPAYQSFVVIVEAENDPPILYVPSLLHHRSSIPNWVYTVEGTDPDDFFPSQHSFYVDGPPGMTVNGVGTSDVSVRWMVAEFAKLVPINISVIDGGEDNVTFVNASTILRINYPPEVVSDDFSLHENSLNVSAGVMVVNDFNFAGSGSYSFNFEEDLPNETFTYTQVSGSCPVIAGLLPNVFLSRPMDFEGRDGLAVCDMLIEVCDSQDWCASGTFTVTSINVNEAPVPADGSVDITTPGGSVVEISGSDPDIVASDGIESVEFMVGSVGFPLELRAGGAVLSTNTVIPKNVQLNNGLDDLSRRSLNVLTTIRGTFRRSFEFCMEDGTIDENPPSSPSFVRCATVEVSVDVECADVPREYLNVDGFCTYCDEGSFGGNKMRNCSSCPSGSYYVTNLKSQNQACLACPDCAICAGAAETPTAEAGCWREDTEDPTDFVFASCVPKAACEGGTKCRPGHMGVFCAECERGFFKNDEGLCQKCPPAVEIAFASMFVLMLLLCLVLIKLARRSTAYFASISVGFNFLQIVAILGTFRLEWPRFVLNAFNVISIFNLDLNLFRAECAVKGGSPYFYIWVLKIMLPVLFFFMLLGINIFGVIYYYFRKMFPDDFSIPPMNRDDVVLLRRSSVNAFTSVLVFMYLVITSTSLSVYGCTKRGNKEVLTEDSSIVCYQDEWIIMRNMSIASITLYTIGLPVFVAFTLYRRRKVLHRDKNVIRFGLLYQRYKAHLYLFELCVLMRKLGIVIGKILFTDTPVAQASVAVATVFIAAIVQFILSPYRSHRVNFLDKLHLVCAGMVLLMGILFGTLKDKLDETGRDALGSIVIVILVANCSAILIAVFLELNHLRKLASHGLVGRFASDRVNIEPAFFEFGIHVVSQNRIYDTDTSVMHTVLKSRTPVSFEVDVVGENIMGTGECFLVETKDVLVDRSPDGTMHYISALMRSPGRYVATFYAYDRKGEETQLLTSVVAVKKEEQKRSSSCDGMSLVPTESEVETAPSCLPKRVMDMSVSIETRSFPAQVLVQPTDVYKEYMCVLHQPVFRQLWQNKTYEVRISVPTASEVVISPTKPKLDDDPNKRRQSVAITSTKKAKDNLERIVPMFRDDKGYVGTISEFDPGMVAIWARFPSTESIANWTGNLQYTDFEKLVEWEITGIRVAVVSDTFKTLKCDLREPTQGDLVMGTEYCFEIAFDHVPAGRIVLSSTLPVSGAGNLLSFSGKDFTKNPNGVCKVVGYRPEYLGDLHIWMQMPNDSFEKLVTYKVGANPWEPTPEPKKTPPPLPAKSSSKPKAPPVPPKKPRADSEGILMDDLSSLDRQEQNVEKKPQIPPRPPPKGQKKPLVPPRKDTLVKTETPSETESIDEVDIATVNPLFEDDV